MEELKFLEEQQVAPELIKRVEEFRRQPERERYREERARERQLIREQRCEERVRRLEEEIGDDEFSGKCFGSRAF